MPSGDPFAWIVPWLAPGGIEAFGLYLARSSALVIAAPLLGPRTGLTAFRVALILILAGVGANAGGLPEGFGLGLADAPLYTALVLRELAIGIFMGLIVQLGALALRVAGDSIGTEMGLQMAAQADPENGISTPLIARFYEELYLLGLFSLGGHLWLVRGLVDSFERAPIAGPALPEALGKDLLAELGRALAAGLSIAAPVLIVMTLLTMGLGLLARTVPQVNIFDLSFNLRVGLGLVALLLFLPTLEPALASAVGHLQGALSAGLDRLTTLEAAHG
jgi:flagellar biosynthesis protein FliR